MNSKQNLINYLYLQHFHACSILSLSHALFSYLFIQPIIFHRIVAQLYFWILYSMYFIFTMHEHETYRKIIAVSPTLSEGKVGKYEAFRIIRNQL